MGRMSVERQRRADGTIRYRVRWREGDKNRAASFDRKGDAEDHNREVKRVKASGGLLAFRKGEITVAEYAAEWWDTEADPKLNRATLQHYTVCLDLRIVPFLGARSVRDVSPTDVEDYVRKQRGRGVGDPSIVKDLAVLSGIFSRAERNGLVARNPVDLIGNKPRLKRARTPVLLTPEDVESVRAVLLDGGSWTDGEGIEHHLEGDRHRDAALVSLLAYSGPRPESEGVTLTWDRVHKQTLVLRASKKRGLERSVKLLAPLAEDLAAWRLRSGGRRGLVFPSSSGAWQRHDWRNWQRRIFKPACRCAGLPADTRARDLRGSFASLLIWSGMDVLQVAKQLGHSAATCLRIYGQAFEEFDGGVRVDATGAIRRARGQVDRTEETG